jgi:hypothetical protein
MKSKAGMFTGTTGRVFLLICAMYFIVKRSAGYVAAWFCS